METGSGLLYESKMEVFSNMMTYLELEGGSLEGSSDCWDI